MKKVYLTIACALALSGGLLAQNDADALRYSTLDFGGTARSLGSANAYGAVGGDFSTLSINPAGLGIYRSSEFVITPGLLDIHSESNYYGESNAATRYNFNLSNIGLVFAHVNRGKENAKEGWVGGAFAIGFNRLANYNSSTYYSGYNNSSSLLDTYVDFLNSGNGTNPSDAYNADPFGAGLAWETYLLNPVPSDTTNYYAEVQGGDVQQSKSITTSGGYNEFALSFAGNYGNRLYIGATIGIPTIRYKYNSVYTEEDVNNAHADFDQFNYKYNYRTDGIGIDAKVGLIYRINDYFRLGAAVHTPTLLSMSDSYNASMNSILDTLGSYSYNSPDGSFDYSLTTPWRIIGSAAFTVKKIGFLSVDYEFLDYSQASFDFSRHGFSDASYQNQVNSDITAKYGPVSDIRIGGEVKYDVFRFRAGYAMMATPFNSGIAANGADYASNTLTFGIGIKDADYFIDLGYGRTQSRQYDIEYVYNDGSGVNQGATIDRTYNNFLLSFGFRF